MYDDGNSSAGGESGGAGSSSSFGDKNDSNSLKGATDNSNTGSAGNCDVGDSKGSCHPGDNQPQQKKVKQDPLVIRVSIFFDGTGNNRTNTAYRETVEKIVKKSFDVVENLFDAINLPSIGEFVNSDPTLPDKIARNYVNPIGLAASFENDYSNISKLEQLWKKKQDDSDTYKSFSIYIEGIGTTSDLSDSIVGNAFGQDVWILDTTGVKSRVNGGIDSIVDTINSLTADCESQPIQIELDSFGFSRGAAAARYFIYQVLTNEDLFGKPLQYRLGPMVTSVTIKFVGLFDTVASFGFSHDDDTEALKMRSIVNAEKVVHLVAADEHRLNFPLTNIASAGGNGTEIYLPGVHSDVGGGYNKTEDEIDLPIFRAEDISYSDMAHYGSDVSLAKSDAYQKAIKELVFFEKLGYIDFNVFKPDSNGGISLNDTDWSPDTDTYSFGDAGVEFTVTRTGISNIYNTLPLQLMVELAQEKGDGLCFKEAQLIRKYPIIDELATLYNTILSEMPPNNIWGVNSQYNELLKTVRRKYFHFSSHYNTTALILHPMKPQYWSSEYKWEDSRRNVIAGERKRRIFPG